MDKYERETYVYNKNGLYIRYALEYIPWQSRNAFPGQCYVPPEFMPLPEFEKRGFIQTVKYRICNWDLFGKKERRKQGEILSAHIAKREQAWREKLDAESKNHIIQRNAACRLDKLRKTGVNKLIDKIKNASDVVIYGRCGGGFNRYWDTVYKSYIDDIIIDLESRKVSRDNKVIGQIDDLQIFAVYQELMRLSLKAKSTR